MAHSKIIKTNNPMAIRVQQVSFAYDGRTVLNDVSLQVPAGGFTVMLGKNGSGKSTLLKVIAGLLPYKTGTIEILGKNLNRLALSERGKQIGFLPQFHNPVFPFTVREVVLTGRASYVFSLPGKRDREKADQAIAEVGVEPLRDRPYTELSGGERQLVMIARVLAQEPKVILLDEPLSHLDLANQVRFLGLVKKMTARGLTVLAVLHDPNLAFLSGDHFVFLKDGRVRETAGEERPWEAALLSEVYGTPIETLPFRDRALVVPF
jgi:iron complex transport system ATP-binding protein